MAKKASVQKETVKAIDTELLLRNRWVLKFHPSVEMDQFLMQSMSPLRFIGGTHDKWDHVQIDILEILEVNVFMKLCTAMRRDQLHPITIEYLNGSGSKYHKTVIEKYEFLEVWQDGLDYSTDDIMMTHLRIRPIIVTEG